MTWRKSSNEKENKTNDDLKVSLVVLASRLVPSPSLFLSISRPIATHNARVNAISLYPFPPYYGWMGKGAEVEKKKIRWGGGKDGERRDVDSTQIYQSKSVWISLTGLRLAAWTSPEGVLDRCDSTWKGRYAYQDCTCSHVELGGKANKTFLYSFIARTKGTYAKLRPLIRRTVNRAFLFSLFLCFSFFILIAKKYVRDFKSFWIPQHRYNLLLFSISRFIYSFSLSFS